MKAADLVVGEEYEITAQKNPGNGPYSVICYPVKFSQGRVKLLEVKDGRYRCEYLDNPYDGWKHYQGKGEIIVTGRSLLRPWGEVVAERQEIDEWRQTQQRDQRQADDEVCELIDSSTWLSATLTDEPEVVYDQTGSVEDVLVRIELPLSVLRGLKAHAARHGAPQPVFPEESASPLGELLV